MTVYVVTPQAVKDWVDSLEKKGAKAFVISTEMHGIAHSPSPKIAGYRIPLAIPEYVFTKQNLSKVISGSRVILPVDDLSWLSESAVKAMTPSDTTEGGA
jgi:hypothetical protein